MEVLFIIGIVCLAALCILLGVCLYKARRFKSMNCRIAEFVFQNVDAYVLLIDKEFNVLKTNYYILNKMQDEQLPLKIGNLLRCTNSIASGECGCHKLCDICPVREAIAKSFREKQNFSKLEATLEIFTSDNHATSRECHVSITSSRVVTDQAEQMLLTIHDITHLKYVQQELIQARIHAEESDRMKSMFLANTSHELRTPLNAIVGFSELLTGDLPQAERLDYIQIIRTNNDILLQLVNDILDLSKIESGTLEFSFAEEDLNTILEELEGIYRHKLTTDRVRIEFDRRYDSCRVNIDRNRFAQIMSNFLSNAVKFTSEGEIVFGYEIREEDYYFFVRDTGIGISEERQSLVFRRFVKIGSHKQGVGIGLAICRSIIELTGGKIGFESKEGKGSTFWFIIPKEQMKSPTFGRTFVSQ